MFYANFVLGKKGPLARVWLAAHWDKKLTKAHVFETNISISVRAILQPEVKLALRTSGHLMLGVVRIYSRKAKYLLADCNDAFFKIKMAFRPGIVDLPEVNREAAVAAITLQENFHDFETTLADLEDIEVLAQFSVNQSRPEEITMREDLGSIILIGDDDFGDVGFDEHEILRDITHLEDPLYKSSDMRGERSLDDHNKTLTSSDRSASQKNMDIDLEPSVVGDGFGDGVGGGIMGHWGEASGLFEDTPMPDVPIAQESTSAAAITKPPEVDKEARKEKAAEAEETVPEQTTVNASAISGGEHTTLVHNEDEAFTLEPLDVASVPGETERKGKRKRKLIVDEQKGIPSETMKLQLSDTSDIVNILDLAPPTKKLMYWKETGGAEKLFVLPGRPIMSRRSARLFNRGLLTRQVKDDVEPEEHLPELILAHSAPLPEVTRHHDWTAGVSHQSEMNMIIEEPSTASDTSINTTRASRRSERQAAAMKSSFTTKSPRRSMQPEPISHLETELVPAPQDTFTQIPDGIVDDPTDPTTIEPSIGPNLDLEGPHSVAPFSIPPPTSAPASVGPHILPTFEDLEDNLDDMPETEEQSEKRLSKRTQQMQYTLKAAFTFSQQLSFKSMARNLNRKQVTSRFYTLLVLKKHQAVEVEQREPFGDIMISEGLLFGRDC